MKNNLSIVLLLAGCGLLLGACHKNELVPDESEPISVLHAQVETKVPDTKISIGVQGDYVFQNNDAIGVFDSEGHVTQFTTTGTGTSVEFSVSGGSPIVPGEYAVFPYGDNASVTGNSVTLELPNEYTYSEWQTSMPMLGVISGDNVSFKSVGGVLMLSIYSVPVEATEMTFTATGDKISGLFTIPNASLDDAHIEMIESEGADRTITFHFTRQTNMVFYIPLPVGTLDGFTISFNDTSHTSRTVTKSIAVSRNSTIIAPGLNLGSSDVWEQHPYVATEDRITEIVWEGMYGINDITYYSFTYDNNARLATMNMGGGIVNTFDYQADGSIDISTTDLGNIHYFRYGNTGWMLWDSHPSENGPVIGYNYDGTMSRVWDHGLRKPGSQDCVWENHNMTNICGEQLIEYTATPNKWCGVSINAFLFSQPPGFPLINDYIANMHTRNVPLSVTSTSKSQTVSFNISFDDEGRVSHGELTGGWRNGERFYVKYNGTYTGGQNPPF